MTTKVNRLGVPNPAAPRILIEVDPLTGNSTMTVKGNINMIGIALALSSQLNGLLPRLFQEMFKNAQIMDAQGQPVLAMPAPVQKDSMTVETLNEPVTDFPPKTEVPS